MILNIRIQMIQYPETQKAIQERYNSKSIRLDVYVEDESGTIYNIEIQTTRQKDLPNRTRYYQGMIDLNVLERGNDYTALKKSFVIFICTYDPFGKGRWIYTFVNRCQEDVSLTLGDEAVKIILNTKGCLGEISDELRTLLHYMDGCTPKDEYTRTLDRAVAEVRADEKWRREYMVFNELVSESKRLGEYRGRVSMVRKFRNRFSADEMAEIYILRPAAVKAILNAIDAHPDWDDEQVAENIEFD